MLTRLRVSNGLSCSNTLQHAPTRPPRGGPGPVATLGGVTDLPQITLPEDHVDEALRNQRAQVRFTIQGVKEKKLPALDDDFAKQVSEGKQETVPALREAVTEDLREAAKRFSADTNGGFPERPDPLPACVSSSTMPCVRST